MLSVFELSVLGFFPTLRRGAGRRVFDPGGRPGPGLAGFGAPAGQQVAGEVPGEAELGVSGDDQPGPAVGGVRVADFGGGSAEGLLEQAEGVFQVEPA